MGTGRQLVPYRRRLGGPCRRTTAGSLDDRRGPPPRRCARITTFGLTEAPRGPARRASVTSSPVRTRGSNSSAAGSLSHARRPRPGTRGRSLCGRCRGERDGRARPRARSPLRSGTRPSDRQVRPRATAPTRPRRDDCRRCCGTVRGKRSGRRRGAAGRPGAATPRNRIPPVVPLPRWFRCRPPAAPGQLRL